MQGTSGGALGPGCSGGGVCGLGTHASRKELLSMDFVPSAGPGFGDTAAEKPKAQVME